MTGRASGVLLHPTSLPGGVIGTLGASARGFVDFLAETGQRCWQMLPVGPPGKGSSPYMATSAFAGSPALLDAGDLIADGLLRESDRPLTTRGPVDFALVQAETERLARLVARAVAPDDAALDGFRSRTPWLEDYAAFTVLAAQYGEPDWSTWDRAHRERAPSALRALDADELHEVRVGQFLFDRQWSALREYAAAAGVELIGDIPIFVAHGSADVWANPELFLLDDTGEPSEVAGVPPDYFSETGQLWGNPIYDWPAMSRNRYAWWTERFRQMFHRFDRARVDHFRGFAAYWSIPAGQKTAIGGKWVDGPGLPFFETVAAQLGVARLSDLPILVEDLGVITPDVDELRCALGLPGMKVLQFSFDDEPTNEHKPENYPSDGRCVVYTGTHDNDTAVGWWSAATDEERGFARERLGTSAETVAQDLVAAAWGTRAELAIAPAQDLLGLGTGSRMNTPGTPRGNWAWRLDEAISSADVPWLKALTEASGRSG